MPTNEPYLHPNMPVISPDDEKGWRRLGIGEPVTTACQYYALCPRVGWRLSSFHTADKLINDGRASYRKPASLKAWVTIAIPLLRKLIKQWYRHITTRDNRDYPII